MKTESIHVKIVDGKWGVVLQDLHKGKTEKTEISIKMRSKEDAVRYARICEQRTGSRVLLPE